MLESLFLQAYLPSYSQRQWHQAQINNSMYVESYK